jgi:rhodanese-related sulfurtransferase
MAKLVDRNDVQRMLREGAQLVDVLPAREYEAEHIPKAISIPLKEFAGDAVRRLDTTRPLIVYCHDYQ